MSFRAMLAMAGGSAPPPTKPPLEPSLVQKTNPKDARKAEAANPKSAPPALSKPGAAPKPVSSTLPTASKPQLSTASRLNQPKPAAKPVARPIAKPAVKPAKPLAQPAKPAPKPIAKPAKSTAQPVRPAASAARTIRATETPKAAEVPKKKISFKEAMKQAANVDKEKLKVTVKTREKEPPAAKKRGAAALSAGASPVASGVGSPRSPRVGSPQVGASRASTTARPLKKVAGPERQAGSAGAAPRQPAPIARPSAKLAAKLKNRRREEDESDSEMDDFIVDDDDDEGMNNDAIQDEIWSIFNKRPRQAYTDYDSDDDMEATGADVFEEELRSARMARREDDAEEERLAALAKRKAQKKLRR